MLKKKLCIRCKNKSKRQWDYWDSYDEGWWEKNKEVLCPLVCLEIGESKGRKIIDRPPNKCPFILEHIL